MTGARAGQDWTGSTTLTLDNEGRKIRLRGKYYGSGSGKMMQADPLDPDPQHWVLTY